MTPRFTPECVIAAGLADPGSRGDIDFDQAVDWREVVRILSANRVPLSSLKDDPDLEARASILMSASDFRDAERAERVAGEDLRGEYVELRRVLLERGVQSILLKSTGLAPSFPYTSDNVDTLVRLRDVTVAKQVLDSLGYVELRNIEEPNKWLFRKFRGGESISAIHLHGVVGWGVSFVDDALVWRRVRPSEDDPLVMVPAPEDAFLVTVAHAFYENKSFKLLDIARMRHCLRDDELDFESLESIARKRGWEDGLAFCLLLCSGLEAALYGETLVSDAVLARARAIISRDRRLSSCLEETLKRDQGDFPFRVSFLLVKILYYRKILRDQQRPLSGRAWDTVSTLAWGVRQKLQIKGQRGMIVSLSGIDGAGKTTHGRALVRAFETSETRARLYWSRFGSSQHEGHNDRNGQPECNPMDIASSLARRRRRLENPMMRACWLTVNLVQYTARCNLHVRVPRLLGAVVVCDRYTYDAMVEIQASLSDGSRWSQRAGWLVGRLCPRPNVAWLLDVGSEVSVERQAEQGSDEAVCAELERQHSDFLALASANRLRILVTSVDPEETCSQLVRETLLEYFTDYQTWVSAIFLANPNQMNPAKGAGR
jgi:thymidylate kinase